MRTTIEFTPKVVGEYYTLDELNELFEHIADVVNAKLDINAAVLTGDAAFKLSPRIINLAQGTADDSAITVAQARAML